MIRLIRANVIVREEGSVSGGGCRILKLWPQRAIQSAMYKMSQPSAVDP
jgi:hypothetical protein